MTMPVEINNEFVFNDEIFFLKKSNLLKKRIHSSFARASVFHVPPNMKTQYKSYTGKETMSV